MTADDLSLLARVPAPILSSLSSRILSRIPGVQFGNILTNEESEKLSAVTSLSSSESQCLVESLTTFFRAAAFASKRPAQLARELREFAADIPEEQLEALTEAWAKDAASLVRLLKTESSSLTGGRWLEGLSWELGVNLASSSSSAPPTPSCKAVLDFQLIDASPPSSSSSSSASSSSNFSLELNHAELYDFYLTLETIQERIDALGK